MAWHGENARDALREASCAESRCQQGRSGCSSKKDLRQEGMRKLRKQIVVLGWCGATVLPLCGMAQAPAPAAAPATTQAPSKVQTQTAPQAQAPLAPRRGLRAADRSPVI